MSSRTDTAGRIRPLITQSWGTGGKAEADPGILRGGLIVLEKSGPYAN